MGLQGGRPSCSPRLFEAGQPGQQPPRLILNRGGQCNETGTPASVIRSWAAGPATTSVNTLTEAGNVTKLPRLIKINRRGRPNATVLVNLY
jgi:hypothetical protein